MMAGDVFISEFLAQNDGGLQDQDGDASDWIEIYNASAADVNLQGWHLTDDSDELTKWDFPLAVVPAGGFLVVFASGKDRAVAGSELHTNFSLSTAGEYLALVEPNGITLASEFDAPQQYEKVSYGIGQDVSVETLLANSATGKVRVPTAGDAALGTSWTSPTFNDGTWTNAQSGIGYETTAPGFAVKNYKASVTVNDLSTAEEVIENPNNYSSVVSENAATVNYLGTDSAAHYGNDRAFPGQVIGQDVDDFVIEATAQLTIPATGAWTFGVNSDDGFGLTLSRGGVPVFNSSFPSPRGASDTLAVFNATEAGIYDVRLTFYERGGGAGLEFFAAQGSHGAFNANFDLVGDTANGGLAVESVVVTGGSGPSLSTFIKTDLETSMFGVNSSAYLRLPFNVADPASYESLTLRMRYDDGFVAYLNGQEIARRNAPGAATWNSTAVQDRPNAQSIVVEEINVTAFIDDLVAGNNVLAIQGLNEVSNSTGFLIQPELVEITVLGDQERYFGEPTPGEFNATSFFGVVADTDFSVDRGFYSAPFDVTITTPTAGATIRYTTDGSEPTLSNGNNYTGPIHVDGTTTVRAVAFKDDFLPTNIDTHSYIFVADVRSQTGAGFPGGWGSPGPDYEVDPNVTNNPAYSATFEQDLLTIPSMSLVMEMSDLFDPATGIYANAQQSGDAWERPGSLEMIYPDGTEGFQINQGVRMQGNVGRNPEFVKHSFRFVYKNEYGPSKLRYNLIPDSGIEEFDNIVLRAGFNNSYMCCGGDQNQRTTLIQDEWARETLRDMGQLQGAGTFVHLYINGLYWGLYNVVERPNAAFMADHLGGDKTDYDALNSLKVLDGDRAAWDAMRNLAAAGLSTPAAYQAIQDQYLDVDNLIDYFMLNLYGGNQDWDDHNWYSGRLREEGAKWQFFSWDAERTLESITGMNMTPVNQDYRPSFIYNALRANPEFRLRFADRIQQHMFNGGAMSVEANTARFLKWVEVIDRAMVGESARWGDTRREPPYTHDVEFVNEVNRVVQQYFPGRHAEMIKQFRAAGLYTNVDPPIYSQHGGAVAPEDAVTLTSVGTTSFTPIIAAGSQWYYLDNGTNQGTAWKEVAFRPEDVKDGNGVPIWKSGFGEFGYGDGGEQTVVGFGPNAGNKHITTYFHKKFNITDLAGMDSVVLRVMRDDGAVVYINGQPLPTRFNMPGGDINYLTPASGAVGGGDESAFQELIIDKSLLHDGVNTIAVEVHQSGGGSSDLSFDLQLLVPTFDPSGGSIYYTLDGSDPRLPGGAPSPTAVLYDGNGLQFDASAEVRARVLLDGEWSALDAATFTVLAPKLRITEIMYHPPEPAPGSPYGDNDFEYLELQNTGATPMQLAGMKLSGGVDFTFVGGALAPGAHVLLVNNQLAFESRYGAGLTIAGEFNGNLNNSSDTLLLESAFQEKLLDFSYSDDWQPSTDGGGFSLVIVNPLAETGTWGDAPSWRASNKALGSPGKDDANPLAGDTNNDGDVNIADLNNVRNNFGASGPGVVGDTNGDNQVNITDLNAVRNNFGASNNNSPAPLRRSVSASQLATTTSVTTTVAARLETKRESDGTLSAWDRAILEFVGTTISPKRKLTKDVARDWDWRE
ncbi:MAG: lamin tail domain-containing protein [Planctomycetia bacterium]|nr:lamin tail domain-containing protein [Planctomycetia bacterium]